MNVRGTGGTKECTSYFHGNEEELVTHKDTEMLLDSIKTV